MGKELWCYRYIDDFYIFFNEQGVFAQFFKCLSQELEKYKLYLNDGKEHAASRPFISPLSIRKLEISAYINDLCNRRHELRSKRSSGEINRLRSLIKDEEVPFSGVSAFLLSSLLKQLRKLYKMPQSTMGDVRLFDILYVYLDLAFHAFHMDIRVVTSFRITAIVLEVTRNLNRLPLAEQAKLMDKIIFELRGGVESAIFQGFSVECMNLFIANALFCDRHPLTAAVINDYIVRLRRQHDDEYSAKSAKRLSYFEIVSLMYYIGDNPRYREVKTALLAESKQIFCALDPCEYAEAAYLLLDLSACPFLGDAEKDVIIDAGMRHQSKIITTSDVGHFRNFVSDFSWYFNWTPTHPAQMRTFLDSESEEPNANYDLVRHEMLEAHLLKKQFMLSY